MTFTVPKMLRPYFLHHRELLGRLSRAAWETVLQLMVTAADEETLRPGMVAVVQTAGDLANWHPHVHALVSRGGWTQNGQWVPISYVDERATELLFRQRVYEVDPLPCPDCGSRCASSPSSSITRWSTRSSDTSDAPSRRASAARLKTAPSKLCHEPPADPIPRAASWQVCPAARLTTVLDESGPKEPHVPRADSQHMNRSGLSGPPSASIGTSSPCYARGVQKEPPIPEPDWLLDDNPPLNRVSLQLLISEPVTLRWPC